MQTRKQAQEAMQLTAPDSATDTVRDSCISKASKSSTGKRKLARVERQDRARQGSSLNPKPKYKSSNIVKMKKNSDLELEVGEGRVGHVEVEIQVLQRRQQGGHAAPHVRVLHCTVLVMIIFGFRVCFRGFSGELQ